MKRALERLNRIEAALRGRGHVAVVFFDPVTDPTGDIAAACVTGSSRHSACGALLVPLLCFDDAEFDLRRERGDYRGGVSPTTATPPVAITGETGTAPTPMVATALDRLRTVAAEDDRRKHPQPSQDRARAPETDPGAPPYLG